MRSASILAKLKRSASALALIGALTCSAAPTLAQNAPAPSEPHWKYYPQEPEAPAGAPNVLLIMTDDVGFAASSTFGGPVPTPTFDQLAKEGLRYNEFHTTAMCSPTRAALLTGRNHHAVGNGGIADVSMDEPGYTSGFPKSAATIAKVLKLNGYDTSMYGKNHNTPTWQNSVVGPFDNWPNAWGFDYFYGFNAPFADQFHPDLVENRNYVRPPDEKDYILDKDLTDHLIHWLQIQHNLHPDHPFFAYFASGSTHTPHMALQSWIDKFKGKFDEGWDKMREASFARQKKLGVIPANAVLTPRPKGLPAWDSLSPELQHAYARTMEVAAAQLAFFDHEMGRVIADLKQSGELDNTMIIYIQGDNGASMEDMHGSNNELGGPETDAQIIKYIGEHGGPNSFAAYPAGWAWATNAPFQWGKRVASHLGGLRDGMVISWADGIKQVGQIRSQFSHVIDIAPTIYEAAHITPPKEVDGVKQQPIDGTSMVYTFDHPDAPTRHREQYFEMLGNRAYYKDGWMASTIPGIPPWTSSSTIDPNTFKWALYDLNTDYSQSKDVSAEHPKMLADLEKDFDKAAKKYHVYPLHANLGGMMGPQYRPSLLGNRESYTYYPGDTRYTGVSFPSLFPGREMIAKVHVDSGKADGPIVVQGDLLGGAALVLDEGKPTYINNPSGHQPVLRLQASKALTPGDHEIVLKVTPGPAPKPESGPPSALPLGPRRGAKIQILVDGKEVAQTVASPYRPARGSAYIGERGIGPLVYDAPRLAPKCDCTIGSVTIKTTSAP